MTTVTFEKNEHGYTCFYCFGHAKFAKKILFGHGDKDILCAAISALTINLINGLDDVAGEKITITENEKTGFLKCDFESPLKESSVMMIKSYELTLKQLSEEYGNKYLTVNFKEVR